MTDLEARLLRGPLRVRSVWSPGSPETLARRILQRRRSLFALDAVAVSGCLALVLLFSGQHTLRAPSNLAAAGVMSAAGAVTAFADGSVAESSSRDSEIHIEQDTANWVVAKLTGGARFHVVPNHDRTFEVRAGDVRVRVLGTTFAVQQLPSGQAQVLVEHGSVEVAWLGGSTLLESGQGGTFPPATRSSEGAEGAEGDVELPGDTAPSPAPTARSAGPVSHAPSRGWREDARAGDYARAYEELNASNANGNANGNGSARARDAVRDEAGDLMLAADVARLSAHPEDAVRPLRAVCDRHAGDRRAPVAAFTLGRVLLDDLGRPAEAAAAFKKARVLWQEGPLAEDALAREADAWERAGRADGARGAAAEYLGRYPQGRHTVTMRNILAR